MDQDREVEVEEIDDNPIFTRSFTRDKDDDDENDDHD